MEELPFAPTNLTAILADLAFVLVLAGGPLLLRWLQTTQAAMRAYYRAHTTAGERLILDGLARDAVAWTEQFAQSPAGQAKFREAIALVQAALDRRGIRVDAAEIEGAVQAAWADMQQPGHVTKRPGGDQPGRRAG